MSGREESNSCSSMELFEDAHQTQNHLRATGPPRQRASGMCACLRVCVLERCSGPLILWPALQSRPPAPPSPARPAAAYSPPASGCLDLPPHWSCLLILFMFAAAARSLSPAPALTLSPYRAGTHFLPIPPIDSSTFSFSSSSFFSLLLCFFTPLSSDVAAV